MMRSMGIMNLIYFTFFAIILLALGVRNNWEFDLGFIIPYVSVLATMLLLGLVLVLFGHEKEVEEDEEEDL